MIIINGIKKFSMYCTYLRNYGSMLLLQQMYTLYNLIPGHNTLSQNTFSKTPSGQNTFLVYTYTVVRHKYSALYRVKIAF